MRRSSYWIQYNTVTFVAAKLFGCTLSLVQLQWWNTINMISCLSSSLILSLSPPSPPYPPYLGDCATTNPKGFEPNESHWFVLEGWGTSRNGVFWQKKKNLIHRQVSFGLGKLKRWERNLDFRFIIRFSSHELSA